MNIKELNICNSGTNIAVIQFAVRSEIGCQLSGDKQNILKQINNINYMNGGGTDFDTAFTSVQDIIAKSTERKNSRKIILLLTDGEGKATLHTTLHQRGVEIFVIGIGDSLSKNQYFGFDV